MVNPTVISVALFTLNAIIVTPLPSIVGFASYCRKFEPVRTTVRDAPGAALDGLIAVSVGGGACSVGTWNELPLDVEPENDDGLTGITQPQTSGDSTRTRRRELDTQREEATPMPA